MAPCLFHWPKHRLKPSCASRCVPQPQWDPEGIDMGASDAQLRATGALGDLPLIVLTARDHGAPPPDLPAGFIAAYDAMFHELQYDLVRLSSRSAHVYAEKSGRFIQLDEPELVIDAVRQLVVAARASEWVKG